MTLFTIGEFSKITGLTVKALRLYHERKIVVPRAVDAGSGYRYYDHVNVEQARIVARLRDLQFSLDTVAEIMREAGDDADMVEFLVTQRDSIVGRISRDRAIVRQLDTIIRKEKEAAMAQARGEFAVEEKEVETILMAGIRFKGRYPDVGKAFGRIGAAMTFNVCGKAFSLYYDMECKEDDADIEACMPVRKGKNAEGISVRELQGGRCVALIHKGPYETIGRSYEKVWAYLKERGLEPKVPTREVYLKGPGMIMKGNPEDYLTEIQVMVA